MSNNTITDVILLVWQHRNFQRNTVYIEDIQAATDKLVQAGYKMDVMPNVGCDGNWQAWTKDPDGVRVELMQYGEGAPQLAAIKRFK